MPKIQVRIGRLIFSLREEKNLSQEELADRSGLHRAYIGHIENGRKNLTVSTLEKVCKGLNISLKDFFSQL